MPDHNFRCGDVLLCISPYYAEQLNIVGQHGIVMGTKPHHIHLWFESQRRSYWITYDLLKKVEDANLSPLLTRIQLLVYQLNAEEWELEQTPEYHRLICYVDEVPFETLQDIRAYLDVEYVNLSLFPEGMGRMITQIDFLQ